MAYKAVVFDFDYTLGDATRSIYAGFRAAFEGMGLPVPPVDAVRQTVGMVVVDAYTLLTGDPTPENRERFYRLFHPVARDMQAKGEADLLPGAAELLRALHDKGVKAAVVSSKNVDSLRCVLTSKGVIDLFAEVIGGGVVQNHKPDPEGLNLALARMGLTPAEILYCGDTVIDAETAQNAGAPFCAVLNGTTPGEAFADWPHVFVAPDLWALKDWLTEEGTL